MSTDARGNNPENAEFRACYHCLIQCFLPPQLCVLVSVRKDREDSSSVCRGGSRSGRTFGSASRSRSRDVGSRDLVDRGSDGVFYHVVEVKCRK
jgi:hypothetical protein